MPGAVRAILVRADVNAVHELDFPLDIVLLANFRIVRA